MRKVIVKVKAIASLECVVEMIRDGAAYDDISHDDDCFWRRWMFDIFAEKRLAKLLWRLWKPFFLLKFHNNYNQILKN